MITYGEVTERPKVAVLKTAVVRATVGSNPTLSAIRAISSVGRAPRLHRGGRRFEPVIAHHIRDVAQPGSASALGAEGRRFESCRPDHQCGNSSAVEHHVANVKVAGSSPVSRSTRGRSSVGRAAALHAAGHRFDSCRLHHF